MKKIGEVSPPFGWRAWPALIDEDSEACSARLACRGLLQRSERGTCQPGIMLILLAIRVVIGLGGRIGEDMHNLNKLIEITKRR